MGIQNIIEIFQKLPVTLLLAGYLAYLGYDYYEFLNDDSSALKTKQSQLRGSQADVDTLHKKIKDINDFARTLDLKRQELRGLAQDLETTKGTIADTLDVPELMKTLLTEAKRSGLTVTSLKPADLKNLDYYAEQSFEFSSTGIYFQYMDFLDRVANLPKIIKADSISIVPVPQQDPKYVILQSTISFRAFKYVGSKADDIAKQGANLKRPGT